MCLTEFYTGEIIEINSSCRNLFNITDELLTGKQLSYILKAYNSDFQRKFDITLLINQGFIDFEIETESNVIETMSLLISVQLIKQHDNSFILYSFKENNYKKKFFESLQISEEKFRTLVSNIPGTVFRCELKAPWKMDYIGEGIEIITGYESHRFLVNGDISYSEIIYPDDLDYVINEVDKSIETSSSYSIEYRIINKSGDVRWIHELGKIYSEKNLAKWIDGVFYDITIRKNYESEIIHKTKELDLYFTHSHDLLCISDTKGNFVKLNPMWFVVLNYQLEELVNKQIINFIHPDDRENTIKHFELLLDNKPLIKFRNRYICKNNTYKWFEWNAFKYDNLVYSIARDVTENLETEQKLIVAKEKAVESDNLKSAFLANMIHEIRTPINAILGFTSLMEENTPGALSLNDYYSLVKQRGKDMINLINDILDYSKIEAKQLQIKKTSGELNSFLMEIYESFNAIDNFSKKDKNVKLNFPNIISENLFVEMDFVRVRQILNNLISNSLKFTLTGTIDFGFTIVNKNRLKFHVNDTGIGIPYEKQSVIFERFSQVDNSAPSKNLGGTGLGLSISKSLVQLLNGRIWFESVPEKGTTFYFEIPFEKAINIDKKKEYALSPERAYSQDKTILVVEDDSYNVKLLKKLFSQTKYHCFFSENGASAINYFKSEPEISLVVLDINLPDMNGYELSRIFYDLNPAIKIIAQSAYSDSEENFLEQIPGCVDFITKPYDVNEFLEKINSNI